MSGESEQRILAARVQKLEERRDRDAVKLQIIEKKLDVLSRQIDALASGCARTRRDDDA